MKSQLLLVGALCLCLFACNHQPQQDSVAQRAMAAYKAQDYKTALPLLKEWANEVHSDKEQFKVVYGYIQDAELKSTGKVSGDGAPATAPAPTVVAATTAPAAPAANESAAPVAADSNEQILDPTTNKPRIPHKAIQAGDVRAMTIKQLGNFEFDPNKDADVPADIHALSGSKVRLRGFIVPWNQADKITDFALVPSLTGCCFGQPPGTQHVITCRLPKNKALAYTVDEISVEGTLTVNVKRDQGYTFSIFELDVTSVKLAD